MSQMHTDPSTGRHYYVDPATGQSYVDPATGQSRWADDPTHHAVALPENRPASAAVTAFPAASAPATPQPTPRLFAFDGGAGGYLGVMIVATLVTAFSLGLLAPWGVVMQYRWRTEHTLLNGHRLRFTGNAFELFGEWVKMWLLCIVTLGVYLFWVVPRLTRWAVEHQQLPS